MIPTQTPMLPQSLVDLLPHPLPAASAEGRTLPTGVDALDARLVGGGLPRGRLTEVVGARGSGKATLLRQIVARTLSEAGWAAYIDATRTLAPRDWAHLGSEGLWMIRPRDPSRAAWCADVLLRCGAFALVVIDSGPVLSRAVAVRLTRLARESGAALVIAGEAGRTSLVGGAVRLCVTRDGGRLESRVARSQRIPHPASPVPHPASRVPRPVPRDHPPPTRRITVVVEKGGAGNHRTVEVNCAIGVARRLCTHPEVPDRRGVARRQTGRPGSERRATHAAVPSHGAGVPNEAAGAGRVLGRKRRCAEPEFAAGDLHAPSHFGSLARRPAATGTLG